MPTLTIERTVSVYNQYRRMRLRVTDAEDIDPNVFLYLALPLAPDEDEQTGVFQGVCSPSDMVTAPIGVPDPDMSVQWVRHDEVTLLFNSANEMSDANLDIVEELSNLLAATEALTAFGTSEVIVVDDLGASVA